MLARLKRNARKNDAMHWLKVKTKGSKLSPPGISTYDTFLEFDRILNERFSYRTIANSPTISRLESTSIIRLSIEV